MTMPKYRIYLSRERHEHTSVDIEAENLGAASDEADAIVSDWSRTEYLNWRLGDPQTPEADDIEELDDEPVVPLGQRGFGQ
jgi:hypothetical protein